MKENGFLILVRIFWLIASIVCLMLLLLFMVSDKATSKDALFAFGGLLASATTFVSLFMKDSYNED